MRGLKKVNVFPSCFCWSSSWKRNQNKTPLSKPRFSGHWISQVYWSSIFSVSGHIWHKKSPFSWCFPSAPPPQKKHEKGCVMWPAKTWRQDNRWSVELWPWEIASKPVANAVGWSTWMDLGVEHQPCSISHNKHLLGQQKHAIIDLHMHIKNVKYV